MRVSFDDIGVGGSRVRVARPEIAMARQTRLQSRRRSRRMVAPVAGQRLAGLHPAVEVSQLGARSMLRGGAEGHLGRRLSRLEEMGEHFVSSRSADPSDQASCPHIGRVQGAGGPHWGLG